MPIWSDYHLLPHASHASFVSSQAAALNPSPARVRTLEVEAKDHVSPPCPHPYGVHNDALQTANAD